MSNTIVNRDGVPTLQVNNPKELSDYQIIDVRRDDEFTGELGHISGAILATLGPDLDTYLSHANKNQKILFICRSGMRSANATIKAQGLGFKEVYNMEGGMLMWNERKFPTA